MTNLIDNHYLGHNLIYKSEDTGNIVYKCLNCDVILNFPVLDELFDIKVYEAGYNGRFIIAELTCEERQIKNLLE